MVAFNDRRNKDTAYNRETPVALRRALDAKVDANERLRFHYQDDSAFENPIEKPKVQGKKNQRLDVSAKPYPVVGYLKRNADGTPVVVHNQRSSQGMPLDDQRLVGVDSARKNRDRSRTVLWQQP